MARLIRADGSEAILRPAAADMKWSLEELQAAVGGYIQIVRGGSDRMIVDGDGRLHGRPVNRAASELLQQWAHRARIDRVTVQLVGDVLILDPGERM